MITQAHKSMLEPATNTNQNKREGKRNKKHKKGNKNSNKSYRHSDNMMDSGKVEKKKTEDAGGSKGFICSSLGKQRKRPG